MKKFNEFVAKAQLTEAEATKFKINNTDWLSSERKEKEKFQ